MNYSKYDEKVARSIHDQLNCLGVTENAVFPKEKEKENYRPRTLIDETLEYIDPTPNIYTLFVQFNERYFWNVLLPVQVKWSARMTSCAGICSFHPRNRECVISLSTPLLKLRPRKDLIETLLHEMIHAYLFLTNDNRDRDGHGPVFQSHMKRINKEAGTNITIYHTFHDEVKLYQQHWWKCNGPCQKRPPYFGTVRRAMNRAPGPNDCWWAQHQATCGGQFIKIKEPEKPAKKGNSKSRASTGTASKTSGSNNLLNWMKKPDDKVGNIPKPSQSNGVSKSKPVNTLGKGVFQKPSQSNGDSKSKPVNTLGKGVFQKPSQSQVVTVNPKNKSIPSIQTDLKKLGNSTNNVHGWGTGGPNGTSESPSISNKSPSNNVSKQPSLSFSGTLGGSGTGRSILLDRFSNTGTTNSISRNQSSPARLSNRNADKTPIKSFTANKSFENVICITNEVKCPICNKSVEESKINDHVDECLETEKEPEVKPGSSSKKRKSEDSYPTTSKVSKNESSSSKSLECPLCNRNVTPEAFNDHLEKCMQNDFDDKEDDPAVFDSSSSSSVNLHDSPHYCLICDKKLEPHMTLNEHLEECVSSVFNNSADDSNIFGNDDDNEVNNEPKIDENEDDKKFPCPVCLSLIEESKMNDHLDSSCLPED